MNGARIGARVEALAAVPHRAGTPAQASVVETVADALRADGLDVAVSAFDVDLPEPGEASLALDGAPAFELASARFRATRTRRTARARSPFFAWAPSGEARGRVVYANHGDRGDYALLAKAGVSVKGAIVLARAGGICRSMKSLLAEEAGAAALLLYPERRDLGVVKPDFPDGPYLNPWAVPRGSMLRYFLYPGDPAGARACATPGLLPRIPALPISETVAREILERVDGRRGARGLDGLDEDAVPRRRDPRARASHGPRRNAPRHSQKSSSRRFPAAGETRPRSSSRPTRTRGSTARSTRCRARRPFSRRRTSSRASRPDGWRPERDVVFAFWDGEEYGMLGSTHWVEERLADLPSKVAAFLYVDSSARAWDFMADVSPGLAGSLDDVLADGAGPRDGPPAPLRARDAPAAGLQRRHGAVRRDGRRAGRAGGLRAAHVRDVSHGLRRPAARPPSSRPRMGPVGFARPDPVRLGVGSRRRARARVEFHGGFGFS